MRKIVIALPKNARLLASAYDVFKNSGYTSVALEQELIKNESKHLEYEGDNVIFLLVRQSDIPQYVDRNWADLGIAAFDCYREYELSSVAAGRTMRGDNFISDMLPDLGFFKNSRFCVAGKPEVMPFYEKCGEIHEKILTVATERPHIAANFFARKGILADIVTVSGSSELMPLYGGAEAIFDIVETGRALVENGLVIFEEAMPIQTKILVSKAALKYDQNVAGMMEVLKNAIK